MNIFKELLFLGGYSTRPQDLVETEPCDETSPGRPQARRAANPASWRALWLLGGRPMHAGCNLDRDEPFEGYATCLGRANMSAACDAKRGPPGPRFSAPH